MTKSEPVALGALVQLVLNAVLTILVVFSVVSLTDVQTAAIYGGANALVVVVVAVKTRSIVWSPAFSDGVRAAVKIADDEALGDVHDHETG